MRYLVILEKGKTGYSAYAPDLPGLAVAGATKEEVIRLMKDGVKYHIEGIDGNDKQTAPPNTCEGVYIDYEVEKPVIKAGKVKVA